MLLNQDYSSAYRLFCNSIIDKADKPTKDLMQKLDTIYEGGYFSRMFLREVLALGEKVYGSPDEKSYQQETTDFFEFVRQLAARKPGDDETKLIFLRSIVKIGVVLVSKSDTYNAYGIEAYLHRISFHFNNGATRVYVYSYSVVEEEITENDGQYSVKRKHSFPRFDELRGKIDTEKLPIVAEEQFVVKSIDRQGKQVIRLSRYLILKQNQPALQK